MKKEVVEIRINKKGDFTFKAKEGFSGTSCVEKTRDLELALGGIEVKSEKTKEYYDSDPTNSAFINII